MYTKILKKDLLRNKGINLTLCIFILLSSFLVSSSIGIIVNLSSSINNLFDKSKVPHFIQMYSSGEINQVEIDKFSKNNNLVNKQQTVELLNISGSNINFGKSYISEAESVMDISFARQNVDFDYLLNLDSKVASIKDGEIGVPIYFMEKNNLKVGDIVKFKNENIELNFKISEITRDAQMNPSIVTSKRLLISDNDFEKLKGKTDKSEYLIEFLLHDINKTSEFEKQYQSSGLPQGDTAITHSLFKVMNMVTDGLVIAVIMLISILLIIIALFCLRYTILSTMEEEYREIGIMKAIGIQNRNIKRLYLLKYVFISGGASVIGYVLSLLLSRIFTKNISLYMGVAEKTALDYIIPFIASIIVFLIVLTFCQIILRKFKNVSAIEAIREDGIQESTKISKGFKLYKSKFKNVNIYLGIKDVLGKFKSYRLLCIVFVFCVFLAVVPVNLLTTTKSPNFMSYMGAGKSDLRIDLQNIENIEKRYKDLDAYINNDKDIDKAALFITSVFKIENTDKSFSNLKVEIGDFKEFPLEYNSGRAPQNENEIALSSLNSRDLEKETGDKLNIIVEGEKREVTVCGTYQDITNGGKTAKGLLPYKDENILWFVANINLKQGVDKTEKKAEYLNKFKPAKVLDVEDYLNQTLSIILGQLQSTAILSIALAVIIAVLIVSMFFRMILAKDRYQISILKSLGFVSKDIKSRYLCRFLIVLFIGIVIGALLGGFLGEKLVGVFMSILGATDFKFIINPLVSYIIIPILLIISVVVSILINSRSINKIKVFKS